MIAELEPYPQVKESGAPSVGTIPAHWRLSSVAGMGRLFKGRGGSKEDDLPSGVPCIRYGDLYTQHEFFVRQARSRVDESRASDYTAIKRGDVLFAASGETIDEIGRSAVNLIEEPAVCGGDMIVLRPALNIDARFLGYAAGARPSQDQKSRAGRGFTVVHVSPSGIKRLAIALPPVDEQEAIVRFLDQADARIRRYIRAKHRLIELLEEQKQAIIHRRVTRGLDPQVGLKPSGVDWLGEIPDHWAVKRAKRILREVDERSTTGAEELLSVSHLTGVTPRSSKNVTMFMAKSHVGHKVCEPGDLVVNTMWAWMGALGVSSRRGIVSPSYAVYRLREKELVDYAYLDLLLRTTAYIEEYARRSTGIRASRLRLYPHQFLHIPLICPPLKEQREIVARAAGETEAAGNAISTALREIDLLKEFRERLIADVVTGKLDVREAAAELPDDPSVVEEIDELDRGGVPVDGASDLDELLDEASA